MLGGHDTRREQLTVITWETLEHTIITEHSTQYIDTLQQFTEWRGKEDLVKLML